MHSDGYYLQQWITRLNDLEARLVARLPEESALPARAKLLSTQVMQAVSAQSDDVLDRLIEDVFLPQLDRLVRDVRAALHLTQHARSVKQTMITPRQSKLLQLSATIPDLPEVPAFQSSTRLRRDPGNQAKIDDALSKLKLLLARDDDES